MKGEVKRFLESEVRKTNRVLKLFPAHLLSRIQEDIRNEFRKIQKEKVKEAIRIAFSDPIIFRVSLTIRIPPEDHALRLKIYRINHPLNDHGYLSQLLGSDAVQKNPILRTFLFHLKEDFCECYIVDNQKQNGRSGSIKELREGFLQVSKRRDGTLRIEYDHWPFARLVKMANLKRRRIDCHFYLLRRPTKYDFGNILDWLSIWAIQDNKPSLMDGNRVFISVYDHNELLLNTPENPFLLPLDGPVEMKKLLGRYESLVEKNAWKSGFDEDLKNDLRQELRKAIIESVHKYDPSKGYPPGYFEMVLKQPVWDFKEKAFQWLNMESLDEKEEEGTPKIEALRAESKSDSVLVDEAIRELLEKVELDETNRIIAVNYGKTDPEIAKVIRRKTGKAITRVAVQKRRTKYIEPLLLEILGTKAVIREDEKRDQIDSQKDPEPEEPDLKPEKDFKI